MTSSADKIPKVALLIETSRGYGRGLLRGIVRYARLHGPWSFYITPGDFEQALPKMRQWGGTGIVARVETPKVARAIRATGLPVVALDLSKALLSPRSPWSRVCEVHPDPVLATNMAVEHLLERSFQRFAFVGIPGRIWSEQRQKAFATRVAQGGYECRIYAPPAAKRDREWDREQAILARWLAALPKPIGLMACNDDRGRQVLEACLVAGVQVPDEVAVVGMDNDELFCELCDPPLSSVALNAERGGFEAAEHLDHLMSGEASDRQQIVVEPLWVATRWSTDVLAMDDREVAAALRFIREHAGEPIQVQHVLEAVPISRRGLEVRFRRAVGRSIHEQIQRDHLERAKRLLLETDMTMERVAESSGFRSGTYLGQVFRRAVGMTPAKYRSHARSR